MPAMTSCVPFSHYRLLPPYRRVRTVIARFCTMPSVPVYFWGGVAERLMSGADWYLAIGGEVRRLNDGVDHPDWGRALTNVAVCLVAASNRGFGPFRLPCKWISWKLWVLGSILEERRVVGDKTMTRGICLDDICASC